MNRSSKPEFDQYAESYTDLHRKSIKISGEDPDYFASYKAKYIGSQLGVKVCASKLSVLDFGCGIGNMTTQLRLALPSSALHGVDPSGESIHLASERHSHEATFHAIDDSRIPYENNKFDIVVAACVFHHIVPSERNHWMSEIHRVLKPSGRAFIFEHNMLNPLTMKVVRDCPFDEDAILLPMSELKSLMKASGFSKVKTRYIVFFPKQLRMLRPLESAFGFIPFGAQHVTTGIA